MTGCPVCGAKPIGYWFGGESRDYFVPADELAYMGNKSRREDYYYGPACACGFDPRLVTHEQMRELYLRREKEEKQNDD